MALRTPTVPLEEAAIVDILTSGESNHKLAARHGRSPSLISLVRVGRLYRNVRPDLPRRPRGRRFCTTCVHWRGGECNYGFPDPHELGLQFAGECLNYQDVDP